MASGSEEVLDAREVPGGASVAVYVKPRASRSVVLGLRAGRLEVAVHSPPVDGAANAELCAIVAAWLGLPRRAVSVERGTSSRSKRLLIVGVTPAELRGRVAGVGDLG